MRPLLAVMLALFAHPLHAQTIYATPQPYGPGLPAGDQWTGQMTPQGAAQQPYGGCYGCSYVGDWRPHSGTARRPAPPPRLQGQWRNGWWYY
jgi:hypothetical protein